MRFENYNEKEIDNVQVTISTFWWACWLVPCSHLYIFRLQTSLSAAAPFKLSFHALNRFSEIQFTFFNQLKLIGRKSALSQFTRQLLAGTFWVCRVSWGNAKMLRLIVQWLTPLNLLYILLFFSSYFSSYFSFIRAQVLCCVDQSTCFRVVRINEKRSQRHRVNKFNKARESWTNKVFTKI